MLRTYFLEQRAMGSPVLVTQRTLDFYRGLARSYIGGSLFGGLALAGEPAHAFLLGGEDPGQPPLDLDLGRVAMVWLIWVAPEHRQTRLALDLLSWGRHRLLEWGFETALMCVRDDNVAGLALTHAFGARPEERIYRFPLREEPGGVR
jgi:hypothetical protein